MKTKKNQNKWINFAIYVISVFVWIVIWHIVAINIDKEIFLPTPGKVFTVLWRDLLPSEEFCLSLINSIKNIATGFIVGVVTGILLAVLSSVSSVVEAFLRFPVKVIKSVPVASFVILSLLWFDSSDLSIFIPAMIVMPTLYINTLTGIQQTNDKLLDMARLFKVPVVKRICYIYIPGTLPYILASCSLAIGMAWKSGIAAEIIALSKNSIGNELYKAKIHLMIPELFAWTIVIVLLSVVCEYFIKQIIKLIEKR